MQDLPFQDLFSQRAASYAEHRPRYPRALVDFLASHAPGTELAWDAGCGSGQLSVPLAQRFRRVVATDASSEQLAHAERHPRVEYRCARAEASGLERGSVDLAVAAQAAHWFELEAYYAEVRRVARRGALVALATYGVVVIEGAVGAAVSRFYTGVLAGHWPPERRLVEEGYRSLAFPFAPIAVPELALEADWDFDRFFGYLGTWSAVRALEQASGVEPLERFRAELANAWGERSRQQRVRWPLALRAGHV